MSYDLYCYKSKLDKPDQEEAESIMEDEDVKPQADPEVNLKIAKALIEYNSNLQIASNKKIAAEEANNSFDCIEMNTKEGELATQITISGDTVFLSVPYWYSGHEAQEVFKNLLEYVKVVRRSVGYFVYDPQTGKVFDPLVEPFGNFDTYIEMTELIDKQINEEKKPKRKPFWKFW